MKQSSRYDDLNHVIQTLERKFDDPKLQEAAEGILMEIYRTLGDWRHRADYLSRFADELETRKAGIEGEDEDD